MSVSVRALERETVTERREAQLQILSPVLCKEGHPTVDGPPHP